MAHVYAYDLRLEGPRESDPTTQTRSSPKTVYVRMKRSIPVPGLGVSRFSTCQVWDMAADAFDNPRSTLVNHKIFARND